ncbi:ATP-BINDING CASSETTE TRANSPORTER [Salix koriyanagi]|uniref:ATP-BINDING CASSETTE TRANSPORTER n=1 Tax=Salix koriyanagi TaxID=2511006 RepID=A0A9Q0Q9Z9_9ROSI|nr:ATP-BINDING CASSETTE TRANSPORTER [Salix koriyanagi]
MEGGDIYRASSSLRGSFRAGSSAWRNATVETFSRSSREEDDEEALKWAAIEKLPTYDRLRKGIITSASKGVSSEVDIENLGVEEKKNSCLRGWSKLLRRIMRSSCGSSRTVFKEKEEEAENMDFVQPLF